MAPETLENLEKQIRKLQRRSWFLRTKLVDYQLNNENGKNIINCNAALQIIEELVTVNFSLRKNIHSALEYLNNRLSHMQNRIRYINYPEQKKQKRKKRSKIFVASNVNREGIGRKSFYFKIDSDACAQKNRDTREIVSSGHRFLSSLRRPRSWTDHCCKTLNKGILDCVWLQKLDELEDAQNSDADEQTIRNLQLQLEKLYKYKKDGVNIGYDCDLVDENFDWEMVSRKYLHSTHLPEECDRAWNLIIKHIKKHPFEPLEGIMLRYVAVKNELQDWEKINQEMPYPRSGYFCFVKYFSLYKENFKSSTQVMEEDPGFFRKIITNVTKKRKVLKLSKIIHKNSRRLSKLEKLKAIHYLKRGFRLSYVSRIFGGYMSVTELRNQLNTCNQRRRQPEKWTISETSDLLKLVEYFGPGQWSKLNKFLIKNPLQCANKYRRLKRNKEGLSAKRSRIINDPYEKYQYLKRLVNQAKRRKNLHFMKQEIENYFVKDLEKKKMGSNNMKTDNDLSRHVLNLLQHLNFDVSILEECSPILNTMLRNDVVNKTDLSKIRKPLVKCFTSSPSDVILLNGRNPFSNVVSKKTNVLPPNVCTMLGLHNLIENQKTFTDESSENLETVWARLDNKLKTRKNFVQAKILWYRILRALFYWPLKLKTVLPEDILNY